ncbi:hypothetical protein Droror1_Dr00023014 [Drosera rotundifolia]
MSLDLVGVLLEFEASKGNCTMETRETLGDTQTEALTYYRRSLGEVLVWFLLAVKPRSRHLPFTQSGRRRLTILLSPLSPPGTVIEDATSAASLTAHNRRRLASPATASRLPSTARPGESSITSACLRLPSSAGQRPFL